MIVTLLSPNQQSWLFCRPSIAQQLTCIDVNFFLWNHRPVINWFSIPWHPLWHEDVRRGCFLYIHYVQLDDVMKRNIIHHVQLTGRWECDQRYQCHPSRRFPHPHPSRILPESLHLERRASVGTHTSAQVSWQWYHQCKCCGEIFRTSTTGCQYQRNRPQRYVVGYETKVLCFAETSRESEASCDGKRWLVVFTLLSNSLGVWHVCLPKLGDTGVVLSGHPRVGRQTCQTPKLFENDSWRQSIPLLYCLFIYITLHYILENFVIIRLKEGIFWKTPLTNFKECP